MDALMEENHRLEQALELIKLDGTGEDEFAGAFPSEPNPAPCALDT